MATLRLGRQFREALGDPRGVTLVEALIGAVIVGIAAVGVALMFSSGQAFINAEGDSRVATYLAQQRIEQVRARGYAGIFAVCVPPTGDCPAPAPPNNSVNLPGSGTGSCAAGEPCYRRTTNIECRPRDNYAAASEACVLGTSALVITITAQPGTLSGVTFTADPKGRTATLTSILAPR
jgi:type II secretory pathway pseudopilin PulG